VLAHICSRTLPSSSRPSPSTRTKRGDN
jgi:hypothetical protein